MLKLRPENVSFSTAPHENVFIRGGSYVSIRAEEWLAMVNERLNPFRLPVEAGQMDLLTFSGGVLRAAAGNAPGMDSFFDYDALR